jgi:hypothetical protein
VRASMFDAAHQCKCLQLLIWVKVCLSQRHGWYRKRTFVSTALQGRRTHRRYAEIPDMPCIESRPGSFADSSRLGPGMKDAGDRRTPRLARRLFDLHLIETALDAVAGCRPLLLAHVRTSIPQPQAVGILVPNRILASAILARLRR